MLPGVIAVSGSGVDVGVETLVTGGTAVPVGGFPCDVDAGKVVAVPVASGSAGVVVEVAGKRISIGIEVCVDVAVAVGTVVAVLVGVAEVRAVAVNVGRSAAAAGVLPTRGTIVGATGGSTIPVVVAVGGIASCGGFDPDAGGAETNSRGFSVSTGRSWEATKSPGVCTRLEGSPFTGPDPRAGVIVGSTSGV